MTSQEIELKLRLSTQALPALRLALAPFNGYAKGQDYLVNTYFDTADYAFSRQQAILRVRQQNQHYTLTAKLAGQQVAGLHQHPEYNLPLPDATPDFPALCKAFDLDFIDPTPPLIPLFQTNFTRQKWRIPFLKSEIEVAVDQGYILANGKKDPICEIECELISGQPTDLVYFVYQHLCLDGITLSGANKALRGYEIAGIRTPFSHWESHWQALKNAPIFVSTFPLLQFEQRLIDAIFSPLTAPANIPYLWEKLAQLYALYQTPTLQVLLDTLPAPMQEVLARSHQQGRARSRQFKTQPKAGITWLYQTSQCQALLAKTLLAIHPRQDI